MDRRRHRRLLGTITLALAAALALMGAFGLTACGAAPAGDDGAAGGAQNGADGSASAGSADANEQSFDGGTLSWDGTELTVNLESTPTAGYSWEPMITGSGLDLSQSGQTSDADKTEGQEVVGGTVTETFVFTGTAAGNQTITLTYKRSWESTAADKEVTIEVATGDGGEILSANAVTLSGAEAAASTEDANTAGTDANLDAVAPDAPAPGSGTDTNVVSNG